MNIEGKLIARRSEVTEAGFGSMSPSFPTVFY